MVCDRGTNALVNKSLAVKTAGGVGMVLTNVAPPGAQNTLALIHSVPTCSRAIDSGELRGAACGRRRRGDGDDREGDLVFNVPAPLSAGFSNGGPLVAGGGDILKPDIIAPGQDILAAVAPPGNQDRLFDLYSGTSMSSPHMAGMGALLKQAHPDWSPMAIKSAFMTTSYDIIETFPGTSAISAAAQRTFVQGAGHVDPNKAVDPGLVFDSDFLEWIAFLEGQGLANGPLPAIDASDLNQASIAIGDLAGIQTVSRSAKSVGSQSETYTFSSQGLPGITVTPSRTSFTAAPGSTTDWSVTFTRTTTAPLDQYQSGFITWIGNRGHVVRMPVVLRPVALSAPAEVTFNTLTGPSSWNVKTRLRRHAQRVGPRPGSRGDDSVTRSRRIPMRTGSTAVTSRGRSRLTSRSRPTRPWPASGSTRTRSPRRERDLDLYICNAANQLIGIAADGDSDEEVTFNFATPTTAPLVRTVYVHGFDVGDGPSASGTLFNWNVGTASAGNTTLEITPAGPVTIGGTKTVTANFSGLAGATRYMGTVHYTDQTAAQVGRTILRVNTP